MFNLGEAILALLEIVFGFWNNQVSLVFELLGQSPTGFKGGGPWGIIEGIEPLFVGIGSALVVLFFVIGFCAESVDIREEIRFEAILRMFIRREQCNPAEFITVCEIKDKELLLCPVFQRTEDVPLCAQQTVCHLLQTERNRSIGE